LLSLFPKEKLTKIGEKVIDEFYMRAKREFDQEMNHIEQPGQDDKKEK
jgi:hypothetical protein